MNPSPEPDDCRLLNDSGILIPNATVSPPTSPLSPTFKHGYFGSAWGAQRILNLEGEALHNLSALHILKKLIDLIGDIELRQGSFSSVDSPLYGPTLSLRSRKQIRGATGPNPYRPCHYFDLICGSGSGGVSAVMLGVMRLTIDEAIDRYERILVATNPTVSKETLSFTPWDRKPKNSRILKYSLQSELEVHSPRQIKNRSDGGIPVRADVPSKWTLATMDTNDKMCKTIVFVTQEARKGSIHRPFAFRSYHLEHDIAPGTVRNADYNTTTIRLVDACQASLSTHSSYDSVPITDFGKFRAAGGTAINRFNPAIEAYDEMRNNCKADVQCLLSLGVDVSFPATYETNGTSYMGTNDEQLMIEAKRQKFNARRFADSKLLDETASLDLRSAIKLTRSRVKTYCEEARVEGHMKSWADRLVRYRRLRAETVRWNEYAGFDIWYPDTDTMSARDRKVSTTSVL